MSRVCADCHIDHNLYIFGETIGTIFADCHMNHNLINLDKTKHDSFAGCHMNHNLLRWERTDAEGSKDSIWRIWDNF